MCARKIHNRVTALYCSTWSESCKHMKNGDEREHVISFPVVWWANTEATFMSASQQLPESIEKQTALVFAISGNCFVVADIIDRGWCIPGGHIVPGELAEEAVRREAHEEAGITLGTLHLLGHFVLRNWNSESHQLVPTFVAEVKEFESIPQGTESRGVRLLTMEELPDHYFIWDALMHSIFSYAMEQYNRIE